MAIRLRWLQPKDTDLDKIAAELNGSSWEVSRHAFTAESLRDFLANDRHFYLVGYVDGQLAGAIHGYLYRHPTGVDYIWVDEVDVSEPHRRKGVGKAMMLEVFDFAREHGALEVWLGTEDDNEAALALYNSLKPTEIEHGSTFSWKVE